MNDARPSVPFAVSDTVIYDLRPTLEIALLLEEKVGSLFALADRLEKGEAGVGEIRKITMLLLSVFNVGADEVDDLIIRRGALDLYASVARFVAIILSGHERLQKNLGEITSPK